MKNLVLIFLVLIASLSIAQDDPSTEPPPPPPVRAIAEWEPMEGVLIRYPFGIPYYFIALLSQEIKVITIVADQAQEDFVISQYAFYWVNLDNCEFIHAPTNSVWTRDYGPLYIVDGNNEVAGVDYEYRLDHHPYSNDIPTYVTDYLNIPYYLMPEVIFDGTSNYMTDGMGVAASSTYALTLNPDLSQEEIENYFYDYQGIDTYHILLPPPGGSHIDTWAKFLAPDKILIRQVPPTHHAYNRSEAAAAYFASQMSSYGRPYKVFRVFNPNNEPYANALILNNRVFFPITGNPENDDAALAVYQTAMPGYEIYGIAGGWTPGDAIHCRTQEIPDRGMLHIHHQPVSENLYIGEDVLVEAKIIPLSGEAVYEDSVRVHYKIDDGEFVSVAMTPGSDYWYSAAIHLQETGSEISYYISAADESGRSENHPYIGQFDPHRFNIVSPLVFQEAVIDDSEQGNDNGVFEPGETVQIIVSLKNKGQQTIIQNPIAHLTTTSPYISIHPPGSATFIGSIDPDQELTLSFTVSASLATPDIYVAQFNLEVETDNGYDSFDSFEIELTAHIIAEYFVQESFENWLPEGWEVTSTSGQSNWQHSNTNLAGGEPPETRFFWEPSTVAVQRLITPNINTSDYAQVSLEFKHYISNYIGDYTLGVETSGDGGNTWTEIMAFPDVNMPATVEKIMIDNEDVGSDEFRIAWTFSGDSWNINWWNIDDVVIGGMNIFDNIGFFQGLVSLNDKTGSVSHVAITSGGQITFPDEN